jgi:hypothetical protein
VVAPFHSPVLRNPFRLRQGRRFAFLFAMLVIFCCPIWIPSNISQVMIESPLSGHTYRITVSGANVPTGPQKFALVRMRPALFARNCALHLDASFAA